mmetsp:Transcript_61922/g.164562  ORF Transcript_61922/g.164562 Transcript_61922/m.164562 type:complete len:231 (+) Transcript_61922:2892-3584(+)
MQLVRVLLQKRFNIVDDLACVVSDSEIHAGEPRWLVHDLRIFEAAVDLSQQGGVSGTGHEALGVNQAEDTQRFLLNAVDDVLIVLPRDVVPGNALAGVETLLQREHVRVEVLLQFLVGEVDAELFERVQIKLFETVDVKQANLLQILPRPSLSGEALVDPPHKPIEESRVHNFGKRVPRVGRCLRILRHVNLLLGESVLERLLFKRSVELGNVQSQKVTDDLGMLLVFNR